MSHGSVWQTPALARSDVRPVILTTENDENFEFEAMQLMLSQNPEESASFVAFLYPSERTCPSWAAFSMTQTFTIPTNAEVYRNKASTSSRLLANFQRL